MSKYILALLLIGCVKKADHPYENRQPVCRKEEMHEWMKTCCLQEGYATCQGRAEHLFCE